MNKIKFNSFHKAFIITVFFSGIGSVLNYLFQIVLGHLLTVEEFGRYNSINSFAANLVIIYTPLSVMLCRMTASNTMKLNVCKERYKQIFKVAIGISLVICIVGLPLYSTTKYQFGVTHIAAWILILFMVIASGGYNLFNGILQGLEKFSLYGFIGILLIGIKFLLSVINIKLGQGVVGVVWAMLISYIGMIILISIIVKKQSVISDNKECQPLFQPNELIELFGATFLSQILVSFYINGGEVILMGYLYESREIGLYSSAVTLGKISLYIVSIVSVVLLPRVANKSNQGQETKSLFFKTIACTFALSLVYAVFLLSIGKYLIPIMFGKEYAIAMNYIIPIVIFTIPLSALSIIHNYFIGIGKIKIYTIVLGVVTVITIFCSIVIVDNMETIPILLGIGLSVVLIWAMLYVWKSKEIDRKCYIDESIAG